MNYDKKDLKFCKDCKHLRKNAAYNICDRTIHTIEHINLVTGVTTEELTKGFLCEEERHHPRDESCCGIHAKFFEEKNNVY